LPARPRPEGEAWNWAELRESCLREAMTILRNRDDAEEAAQEAMLRSWRWLGQCRAADPLPWAKHISRNEALRIVKRRALRGIELPSDELPEAGSVDLELERLPATESVRNALEQMPATDQLLIRLRYTEDLTQPQLARAFDLPEGTVKIRLHRARARMRALLVAAEAEPAVV
jgi:RNA polymerase sigma-70 factor, ECF subfamily